MFNGQDAPGFPDPLGQPSRIDAIAASQVEHPVARLHRQIGHGPAQLLGEGAVIGHQSRGIAGQLVRA